MSESVAQTLWRRGVQVAAGGVLLATVSSGVAVEWRQLRGPNHDGSSPESILKTWPSGGPPQIWKRQITNGFSSMTVSQGRLFSQAVRKVGGVNRSVCLAFWVTNGVEAWAATLGTASYGGGTGIDSEDGPRSTPTVHGGWVYVLDHDLILYCLSATNGTARWSRNLRSEYSGSLIGYKNSASPVVDNDLIFVNVNCGAQSLLALHVSDGSLAWRNRDEDTTHATPVVATIQGVRQVIFYTQAGLTSLDCQSGAFLWQHPFEYNGVSSAASPVVYSNMVFCTAAYSAGATAARVTLSNGVWKATGLWTNSLQSHWMTPVCHQGFLYGQFGSHSANAPLACVNLATGRTIWTTNGFGCGGTILADGHLIVLTESGKLVLAKAQTNAYTEVTKFQAITGTCWNVPVVSEGRLYARSTKEMASYDVLPPAPTPLRWLAPQRGQGNALVLRAANTNGTAIDSNRLSKIQVRASTNLSLGASAWTPLTNVLVISNGLLRVTAPGFTENDRRYFITVEQP